MRLYSFFIRDLLSKLEGLFCFLVFVVASSTEWSLPGWMVTVFLFANPINKNPSEKSFQGATKWNSGWCTTQLILSGYPTVTWIRISITMMLVQVPLVNKLNKYVKPANVFLILATSKSYNNKDCRSRTFRNSLVHLFPQLQHRQ